MIATWLPSARFNAILSCMSERTLRRPTEQDATTIVTSVLGQSVLSVRRFPTGLCHYVYDVATSTQKLVVRIADPNTYSLLAAGVYWSQILSPLGVPLPRLMYSDLECKIVPFAFMLLERLPGTDLGNVYPTLSPDQKYTIAGDVVRLQRQVGRLPSGSGFGYATALHDPLPHRTWSAVVFEMLNRSRQRLAHAGIVDPELVGRVQQAVSRFESYLTQVAPTAFLDDTTTKNVIVHDGRLSGIVDVDFVCYGDPLWTVGLTQMALLKLDVDLEYIAAWTAQAEVTDEQRHVIQLYTAVFCADFLSELGHVFNNDRPQPVDQAVVVRLLRILDDLLHTLA